MAHFTPGHFFKMATQDFYLDTLGVFKGQTSRTCALIQSTWISQTLISQTILSSYITYINLPSYINNSNTGHMYS